MEHDQHGMEILTDSQCVELLEISRLGRVALTHKALPIILPVTFGCLDRQLIFSVAPGILARAAEDAQIVCFETDWVDESMLNAWSVSVIGRLTTLSDPWTVERVVKLSLAPWTTGPATIVALAPELYSGRRTVDRPQFAVCEPSPS